MSRSNLRIAVIVLTLITLVIHAYLGFGGLLKEGFGGDLAQLHILWSLNALGYAGLLAVFLGYIKIAFLNGKNISWALMGFAALTIIAWVAMSGVLKPGYSDSLAYATKVDEVLLIVATYLHMRA
jgi:hypothetical protein